MESTSDNMTKKVKKWKESEKLLIIRWKEESKVCKRRNQKRRRKYDKKKELTKMSKT